MGQKRCQNRCENLQAQHLVLLVVDRLDAKIGRSLPPQAPVRPNRGSLAPRDFVARGIKGRDGKEMGGLARQGRANS